jgi:hypothetical protein
MFFDNECIDSNGRIKKPVKSILDIIVLGYRPVTTLSIFELVVENKNKPMYGAQIGRELEEKFQLPKGWFTKTRYYDTRIGKLLKILCRLDILRESEIIDPVTRRQYVGYHISENIYPSIREKILRFFQEGTFSVFVSAKPTQESTEMEDVMVVKRCAKCHTLTTSSKAQYCELCGNSLDIICSKCKREISLEYAYCLYCGEKLA